MARKSRTARIDLTDPGAGKALLARSTTEASIRATLKAVGAVLGIRLEFTEANAYRAASKGGRGGIGLSAGYPDLSGWITAGSLAGKAVLIETKRPGNYPTELQYNYIWQANMDGAVAIWMDSTEQAEIVFGYLRSGWVYDFELSDHKKCVIRHPRDPLKKFWVAPHGKG